MAMHLASLVHGSAQEWDVKAATQPLTTMSESQPGSKSHQHESDGASESERAYRVWNHKFGARQLSLGRDDAAPFTIGRYLGGGGIGVVHEIRLETIPLAIKRTYTRKLTIDQLNEIKILSRLSEQRHHHVVQLVGSYIHQQRAGYELGLLIWPVAHCDLSVLLNDLGTLAEWLNRVATMDILDHNIEDIASPLELLSQLAELEISQDLIASQGLWLYTNELVLRVKHRLLQSFGCIAKAVAHIHHHGIRHKDLKPSQILLSPTGLWLTDFGWSADRSEFNQSATSGGDQMTIKYQAPERASMQSCGRPEDVFATGCIFLEIFSYTSTRATSQASVRPWLQKGWFFHANLGQIYDILDNPMETSSADYEGVFNRLLRQMLAKSPRKRPTIRAVLNMLKEPPYQYQLGPYLVNSHFGHCCQRKLKMNRANQSRHTNMPPVSQYLPAPLSNIEQGLHATSEEERDYFSSDHSRSHEEQDYFDIDQDTLEARFSLRQGAANVGNRAYDSAGTVDVDMQDAPPAEPHLGYDCRVCAHQFKRQDARRKHEWNKHQLPDTKPTPRRRGAAKLREARLSEDHRNSMPNSFEENSYIDPVFGGGAWANLGLQ